MERENIARFPRPVKNRIPNFVGAERAAARLAELPQFKSARIVKVNPDSPQRSVRFRVLKSERILLMPTPRLREGFLAIDGAKLPASKAMLASSISGAYQLARKMPLKQLPKPDLLVVGSVAVTREGLRIGKGEGYSEIEYGILRELNLVDETTPIVTTVHDSQIVDKVPAEKHDLAVDVIVTPTQAFHASTGRERPKGIYWDLVNNDMLERMPILKELRGAKTA